MTIRDDVSDTGRADRRRTQAERSAATKAILSEAVIDILVENGWPAVTVVEVCGRAGVTRGAFHHHYGALPQLIADALRLLYGQMIRPGQPPINDLVGLIDANWSAIGQPRFKAVLEAWLAMANDPDLRDEIGPVVAEFAMIVQPARLTKLILADDQDRDFFAMARETMLGLALGRATNGGRPLSHEKTVLDLLRRQATGLAADIDSRSSGDERHA